jgi:hypothetical protein
MFRMPLGEVGVAAPHLRNRFGRRPYHLTHLLSQRNHVADGRDCIRLRTPILLTSIKCMLKGSSIALPEFLWVGENRRVRSCHLRFRRKNRHRAATVPGL